ncbi:MAG: hypothetical protein WBR13_16270 [Allosphingosinicella sp.]
MGGWEEMFGEGVDACDVIDSIDRSWREEEHGAAREAKRLAADPFPFGDKVTFATVVEADDWVKANRGVRYVGRPYGRHGWKLSYVKG